MGSGTRLNLRIFRVSKVLSQQGMAAKLGYKRALYGHVESGRQAGSEDFWRKLQEVFNLTDERIEELKAVD